jgi:succinate dehydrogenase/fumarate reductase flavoprotein subunit
MSRDLLVIGGGIAGTATAAHAAGLGASVTVIEKGDRLGGSGALSAGILWTAPDRETLRRVCPGADEELGMVLVDGFDAAVERVRASGVEVSERWQGQMGFGVAHRIDIHGLLDAWRERIETAGGEIVLGGAARELIVDGDEVRGARIVGAAGTDELAAGAVVLATGGFQGAAELVRRFIGEGAERMPVRSNPNSTGDGFRLGRAAGAAPAGALDSFYGHLLPSPLRTLRDEDFLPLTQYHSNACVVVNRFGRRFADESHGDEVTNQALLRQRGARGVLLCDERVRLERAVAAPYPHGQEIDRFEAARSAGARTATAASLDELVERVADWGVNGPRLAATLAEHDAAATGAAPAAGDAPMPAGPQPLREPPFHALEVQPSITFTFGGLRADTQGCALASDGAQVPGLFVCGADMGGVQDTGYVGGLVLGIAYGPRVAEAALGEPAGTSAEVSARG